MKIPLKMKDQPVIALGHLAIWCNGLLTAAAIADKLVKRERRSGIPCMGSVKYNGKKYYWCRYGFLYDPDIYTSK